MCVSTLVYPAPPILCWLFLDYICYGHDVAYVGEHFHLSAVRDVWLFFGWSDSLVIGRIWSTICKHQWPLLVFRFRIQSIRNTRLSRDCDILSDDSTEVQWKRTLLSFRTFDRYLKTLDALLWINSSLPMPGLWLYAHAPWMISDSGELWEFSVLRTWTGPSHFIDRTHH